MSDSYFLIHGSEDGGCYAKQLTKEQIEKALVPNKYGDYDYGKLELLSELPKDICNFTEAIIIKGKIIVPKPKQVVTEYEIE